MAEKKRRRGYLADFTPSVDGEYVYTGALCRFAGDERAFGKWRLRLGAGAVLPAAVLFAAGFLPAPGSTDRFYVILPFLAAIICAFVGLWKSVRVLASGKVMREYVYTGALRQLPGWGLGGAIACAVTALAEIVHLCLRGFDGRAGAALGLLALLAGALGGFLLLRRTAAEKRWNGEK